MHPSIEQYLEVLHTKRRAPATLKVVRQDLTHLVAWWEGTRRRTFDPALLRHEDLRDWRTVRQRDDGAAPATINRGLASLRGYCHWALAGHLLVENPMTDVKDVPTEPLAPRSLPPQAIDALVRAASVEPNAILRARDEAMLALLIYAGLRVQEVCDIQLRDLDLGSGTVTIRSGKAGKARRVPLHADAQRLLRRYLDVVRCPAGLPSIGSDQEREKLLVGINVTSKGQPAIPGITQRVAQRAVQQLGKQAALQLRAEAQRERNIQRSEELQNLARQLEKATPHMLRHSLARRMLERGAQLPEVQRTLGHSRLSTTGVYLTPSEEEVRAALGRAGIY
ncbi:MAG TPA: tyrosine-type recombinase/integrase [Ktedonobacteraceae bacterium]